MRFGSKISTKQQITATDSQRLLESDPKHNRVDQKYHSKKHNPNDPEPINLRDRGLFSSYSPSKKRVIKGNEP